MAIEFKAPFRGAIIPGSWSDDINIFVAGTIEMGNSRDWQKDFVDRIKESHPTNRVNLYNPRREFFDPSWEQSIDNEKFREQVEWELEHIEKSHIIVFNFEEGTISPISLAELGLCLRQKKQKVLVHCPEGYKRNGNVHIMCNRYGTKIVESFDDLVASTQKILDSWIRQKESTVT